MASSFPNGAAAAGADEGRRKEQEREVAMATMIAALQKPRPTAPGGASPGPHEVSFVTTDGEGNETKETILSKVSKAPKKEEDRKKDLLTDPFDILVEMRRQKRALDSSRRSNASSSSRRSRSRGSGAGGAGGDVGGRDSAPPGEIVKKDTRITIPIERAPCCPKQDVQRHLVLSIFVFVFCNICFGGAAIWSALQARKAAAMDNSKDAYLLGKQSRRCAAIGIFVTVGMVSLFFIMYKLQTEEVQRILDSLFGSSEATDGS